MSYYSNEDKCWYNQQLLFIRDTIYGSNSLLDISMSVNTTDKKYYSAPALMFNLISKNDTHKRYCKLNFHDVMDLTIKLRKVISNPNEYFIDKQSTNIIKKFGNNSLNISFHKSENYNNEFIISFEIIYGETDIGSIYIPYFPEFISIVKKLESYCNNCDNIAISMTNRTIFSDVLSELKNLNASIKVLPSLITVNQEEKHTDSFNEEQVSNNQKIEKEPENSNDNQIQNNFSSFMDEKLNSIEIDTSKVPLEDNLNKKSTTCEYKSPIIKDILNNDIVVFEDKIMSIITNRDPFIKLFYMLDNEIQSGLLSDDINDEIKSVDYISNVMFGTFVNNYLRNGVIIPSNVPIPKFKTSEFKCTEAIYDLLLISCFSRLMRIKIEDKDPDAQENKSILNLAIRCFIDPIIYSYIDHIKNKKDILKSCIISRFEYHEKNGFFENFQITLDEYKLKRISSHEISQYIENFVFKFMDKIDDVEVLHNNLLKDKKIYLPFKNPIHLDQIYNAVRLNIEKVLGSYDIYDKSKYDKKVLSYFENSQQKINKEYKSKPKKEPNVFRIAKKYRNEIPEKHRDNLLDYLNKIEDNNYDWKFGSYNLEEFGDNILKILYSWNESSKKESYKDFISDKFEQPGINRDMILSKINAINQNIIKDQNSSSEWDNII